MDNYGYQPDINNASGRPFVISRYPSRNGQNDYLVEVNSRGKIFKKPGFYKVLSAILLFIAILFLIGFIVLMILYSKSKPKVCVTDECLKTATNLKYSIDLSADPCENFYEYTCGRWSEEHPNHGWWKSFSSFTTISEKVAISTMSVLTSNANDTKKPEAVEKSKNLYKSCMDEDAIDNLGLTSMYPYLKRARLPIVPSFFNTSITKNNFVFDWIKSETLLKQIFMMDVFIGFMIDNNIYNGSQNVIYIGLIAQSCPLPSPIRSKKSLKHKHNKIIVKDDEGEESEFETLVRKINSNIMKFVFKEVAVNVTGLAPSEDTLQEAANVLMDIADVIEELNANYTDPDVDEDDIYPITFKTLQDETDKILKPNTFDWSKYFKNIFTGTNVTIDSQTDLLYVTSMELQYLYKLLPFLMKTSPINLELYLWWSAVYAMLINTSSDVVDYVTKQLNSIGSSSSGSVARSQSLECALLVINYMGYAVSYALADQSFPLTTKPKVERMITELKQAFVERVNSIGWMDAKTKKVTLEKSKEMLTFIGYPDWLFADGKLDDYYSDVEINADTFLDNMISVIISHNLQKMDSLREVHKRDWSSEPIEVNAFNSFSDNAINVPMAILSFPMYNLGLEVLNYGSIGSILGHELTHGFDNLGRKHDKYGNHVQWWSNQTIETFENLTKCFVDQYDNFTIEGIEDHIKGKITLGENLADNGGLNQAFTAFKNHMQSYGEEGRLPGFENFTSYQLFFIAYGSIWCETTTLRELKRQIENDEHCPNAIRVLGTLQNSEEFAKAFNCPSGSFMNPNQKCKIW